jgi:branched-chain amino acid transport system permease protein
VLSNDPLISFGEVELKSLDVLVFSVTLGLMWALNLFVFHTKPGKAMRAVSQNMKVASLMGINVNRVISMTFALGSALAGAGSVLVGLKYPKIDPLMGTMIGLKAFVAAVLGGIGNMTGAVIGALIMGLSEQMVVGYWSSTYRDALAFGILIFILIFKPSGLMGKNSTEKV